MTHVKWMHAKTDRAVLYFLVCVMVIHTLTYIIARLLASTILDYRRAFTQPIIQDYMVRFGATSVFWGPLVQLFHTGLMLRRCR